LNGAVDGDPVAIDTTSTPMPYTPHTEGSLMPVSDEWVNPPAATIYRVVTRRVAVVLGVVFVLLGVVETVRDITEATGATSSGSPPSVEAVQPSWSACSN